jgi:hypothetical protein
MAVMPLFKNLDRLLPVREQLADSAHDPAAESAAMSAETHLPIAIRRVSLILQRLEAGQ